MKNSTDLLDVYRSHGGYLAQKSSSPVEIDLENLASAIFTPGPFYYYVLDSASLTFDYCSENTTSLLGIDLKEKPLSCLIDRIHPDDIPFVLKCEEYVAKFVLSIIDKKNILKYKFSYAIREKTESGEYRLFLMQTVTLALTETGALSKVMGIHSDISAITGSNNYKLSIIDLKGNKSVLGVDVFENDFVYINAKELSNLFSKREREVVLLLGEGYTAKEIGEKLFISEQTVISHRKRALEKSGCKNSVELVAYSIRNGLV